MQYRRMKDGTMVSVLGYGCMRFTTKNGRIIYEKAENEILHAVKYGVNYFDTAYIYPGSEELLGKIMEKNRLRDKMYIATKLPYYLVKSASMIDSFFNEELKRLRTDHVDFYLMHMLSDVDSWERMKGYGIEEWIKKHKADRSVRNVGFSFHGDTETFIKLLDAYDWDFCQIQYNYLDEHTQAGRRGLQYAASKGIPVVIMEPLRGGRLITFMPEKAKKLITDYPVQHTPAEWALKWLWDQPEVTCVLSGMNSLKMLRENVRCASHTRAGELTERDHTLIKDVRRMTLESAKVGCTGCRYCMPCPRGVDIPMTFNAYNRTAVDKLNSVRREYIQVTSFKKKRSDMTQCVECGKCEKHCPQHIPIRKELKNARKVLLPWYVKLISNIVNLAANK